MPTSALQRRVIGSMSPRLPTYTSAQPPAYGPRCRSWRRRLLREGRDPGFGRIRCWGPFTPVRSRGAVSTEVSCRPGRGAAAGRRPARRRAERGAGAVSTRAYIRRDRAPESRHAAYGAGATLTFSASTQLASVAHVLTAAGKNVLVLEAGGNSFPGPIAVVWFGCSGEYTRA